VLTSGDISKLVKGTLLGKKNIPISSIGSIDNAREDQLSFLFSRKKFNNILLSKASVVLISNDFFNEVSKSDKTLIFVDDVKHALSTVIKSHFLNTKTLLKEASSFKNLRHVNFGSNCYIGENVTFGSNCRIGNNVVIENNTSIGDNVEILHNVVIHNNVSISNNVKIDSGSIIGSEGFGNFLNQGKWNHIPHIGSVQIHDNVCVGSNCCIDRGTIDDTIIHNGVIIDNLVHIAHNVVIGENSAIAAKVGIAGSSIIGKRNMIGGMVGIVNHVTTTDDVIISATSTITRDIVEPGIYTGIYPAMLHQRWKRITLLLTKLDKIAKFLNLKKI